MSVNRQKVARFTQKDRILNLAIELFEKMEYNINVDLCIYIDSFMEDSI